MTSQIKMINYLLLAIFVVTILTEPCISEQDIRNPTISVSREPSHCEASGSCDDEFYKRYILYEVNPGEGFNLKRDVYTRIAPLIYSLNKDDPAKRRWILVLPPWGRLPHWRNTSPSNFYPWKTFFEIDKIKEYIPVIEFEEYHDLEESHFGQIDTVYQLQHFPFNNSTKDWSEKIETPTKCEDPPRFKSSNNVDFHFGNFWSRKLKAANVQCMSLRGQASTLKDFILLKSNPTLSIMFDRAEVILWDHYGGVDWWKSRLSLQFANNLKNTAEFFLKQNNLISSVPPPKNLKPNSADEIEEYVKSQTEEYVQSTEYISSKPGEYLGVHLRRRDFLYGRKESLPSLDNAAKQIATICKKHSLQNVFLATDADQKEIEEFQYSLAKYSPFQSSMEENSATIRLIQFKCRKPFIDGECAIIDQIINSYSKYFIGTEESTFTFRIFEEREILSFEPSQIYNYLCRLNDSDNLSSPSSSCKKPTQWRIPQAVRPRPPVIKKGLFI